MSLGQHGALRSSSNGAGRAHVISLANGSAGLPLLRRATAHRSFSSSSSSPFSRMTAGSSRHPPNWRLWHPNQGIVFQQPSYPNLDAARFFSEASAAEIRHHTPGVSLPVRPSRTHAPKEQPLPGAIDHDHQFTSQLEAEFSHAEGRISAATDVEENPENHLSNTEPAEAGLETGEVATIDVQPFTPLKYSIPEEVFRTAKAAPAGSAGSFWSHSLYRGPEDPNSGEARKVKVQYCRTPRTAERALQNLKDEEFLGLDLEWYPQARSHWGPRKNVSLVQIASPSRVVLLHLAAYPQSDIFLTPTLKEILEDPGIRKTGVFIKGDCARLKRYLHVETRGMFELSHLFNQVKCSTEKTSGLISKKLVSLARQVQETTGLPLYKEQSVRASDWSQPLSVQQIEYSASDAYAGVQLFAMLNHQRLKFDPVPDLPFHAELNRPIPSPPGLKPPTPKAKRNVEKVVADKESLFIEVKENETLLVVNDAAAEAGIDASTMPTPKGEAVSPSAKPAATSRRGPVDPTDPRILAAEAWNLEYMSTQPKGKNRVAFSKLRAYNLWHVNKDLNPVAISKMLQIQPNTVVCYILEAVMLEKLPYDKVRMKAELVGRLPPNIVQKRYPGLWTATKHVVIASSK